MARIVIVEDDGALRHDMADRLEGWGHAVSHSSNIAEGQSIIENIRPDIILCDINMPSGSGFSLFNILNEEAAKYPRRRFIFMTSISDPLARKYGIESGADGYIAKPINYSQLKAVIDLNVERATDGWAAKLRKLCGQSTATA